MNAIQAPDPLGRFFNVFLGDALDCGFWRHTPGVVCFVIDDEDVGDIRHLVQYPARECFVALRAFLDHLGTIIRIERHQRMPVTDQHFALPQLVVKARRNDVELIVIVVRAGWLKHLQSALHRQSWGDNEDVLREPFVLRIDNLVERLPSDDHRHQNRLA